MRPPAILQNNWLRRVMLDLEHPTPHVESFFIKANDPRHDRTLWLRLTLASDGRETFGEAWGIYFDRQENLRIAIKERWPVSRIFADPERAGVGIGPCSLEEGRSYGLVQGDSHSLSWDLSFTDEAPEFRHLPSERLYRTKLVTTKVVSPHPSATLSGRLELWHGKHRRADCVRIDLAGWRGMQGHHWGRRHADGYAWAHCNIFSESAEGAYFEAVSGRPKIGGILPANVSLGRLVIGDQTYRFDTWAGLGGRQSSDYGKLGWRFSLSGPDGSLTGEVQAKAADTVALEYSSPQEQPLYCLNSQLADLTLTLTPKHGASRSLHSGKATLELGQRDKPSDVPVVL
jgi:hypothetical protein